MVYLKTSKRKMIARAKKNMNGKSEIERKNSFLSQYTHSPPNRMERAKQYWTRANNTNVAVESKGGYGHWGVEAKNLYKDSRGNAVKNPSVENRRYKEPANFEQLAKSNFEGQYAGESLYKSDADSFNHDFFSQKKPYLLIPGMWVAFALILVFAIEIVQHYFFAWREGNFADVLSNLAGVTGYILVGKLIALFKKK